jgi:transposase
MNSLAEEATCIGVGIDTARYGHRVTFLRSDKQPAAPPLDVLESAVGYARLREALDHLAERFPGAAFYVRIDAAGQYATNLERFLRSLPLPLEISVGEPARNAAYRKAHFPKRKTDPTDSAAQARYAVVERPTGTPGVPAEFATLREVAGRLESQATQTTRAINQLHNLLGRVFPELATLVRELRAAWVLKLLARYPTPAKLARAQAESLASIPYLKAEVAERLQAAARASVGTLRGEAAEMLVRESLREVELSRAIEKRLHGLLTRTFEALPDGPHRLLTTIPGIGTATAAALVAKMVSIDHFATEAQLVSFFGVFPEENTSGYDRRGNPIPPGTQQMSRQGNDLVRRYLWMAAKTAILHNPAVRALYARLKARGKRGDVALGHCMRKLLHLVFAIWKTGRPFDPQHYDWEGKTAAADMPLSPETLGPSTEKAAGHKEAEPRREVVTAATRNVGPAVPMVKLPAPATPAPPSAAPRSAGRIDYAALRRQVTMDQVLSHLGWLDHLQGNSQRRGPCPIHGSATDHSRSFSVALDKQIFRCFAAECAAHGNVLDLWAAVHHLPLYDAALHLAETFRLSLPSHREEEPVSPPHRPSRRHHARRT